MKLQQAYVSEAVAIGNWQIIGYKGPGEQSSSIASATTNFEYSDGGSYSAKSTAELGETAVKGFAVKNKTKLNDCDSAADNWKVEVKKAGSSEGDAEFTATVATVCNDLTPNFDKIGK
ncbi:MAG: hypothetical protein MJZ25_01630 [Fibrobacter sp.]|nr:hypothetical protein [Fibrobacter sp.]